MSKETTNNLVQMLWEERSSRVEEENGRVYWEKRAKDLVTELRISEENYAYQVKQNDILLGKLRAEGELKWNAVSAKIAFIKLIREVSGAGLKESKEWVDQFIADHTLKTLE